MVTTAQKAQLLVDVAALQAKVNALSVDSAPPAEATLWTTATNAVDGAADAPVTIGTKFRASVPGQILGVRFYKYAGNTGAHIANLWSSTGTKLATATFSAETVSGWQEVRFATPMSIAAATDFVVSYQSTKGHYAFTTQYFASPYTRGQMSATAGVYTYGAAPAFPVSAWQSGSYWVDAIFKAT